jgi:tripartite-type tricarboxylate transporter receptor subunit TctC
MRILSRPVRGTLVAARLLRALLLSAALVPCVGSAQDYPSRIVTIVVPFSAGGSNDAIARNLAESLGRLWKQTVIVENRPGGGSAVGAAYVAKSPPDGYKLLLASSSYTTNAAMRTDQSFDPVKDLKPTNMVARGQIGIVSGTRVPIATLADLAREAKAQTIFYGTAGVGSSQHFNGELLNEAMGIQMQPIPYRGGNEALLDLAAGRIDIVVGTLGGLLPSIEAGRAKAVAVMGRTRSPAVPNAQTTTEAGYPAAYTENYWAIFVPAATPEAVVRKIHDGIRTVTNAAEGRQFLAKLDGEPTELSPQEVSIHVRKEIDYWTRLAKKLNISAK